MIQQVILQHDTSRMTAVVDHPRLLTPGSTLVLKDSEAPSDRWTVREAFALPHRVPRGWKNSI